MLGNQGPAGKTVGVIIWQDGHFCLGEDRSVVQFRGYQMHAAARDLVTGVDRPLISI